MPITNTDIQFFLSGGAGNSDPNASLGGIISSTQVTSAALHNLFDQVSGPEAAAGDIEYRCIYVKNNHGSLTWEAVAAFIQSQTTSGDTSLDIGLDPAGNGDGSSTGVATTIANENTAPGGVSFSAPSTYAGGLSIGNLTTTQVRAVWIRWTVSAAAAAFNTDTTVLRAQGDTAP